MLFCDFRVNCVSILAIISITCSVPFVSTQNTSKEDKGSFFPYKKSKEIVRAQLVKFDDSDLEKEAKLTSVKASNGVISFYQYEKTNEKVLFSLDVSNAKSALYFPKNIVLGVKEISTKHKTSDQWMSSVFLALRQCNSKATASNESVSEYFAIIAYVSKDSIGTILEWDQWTFMIMKNLVGKKRRLDELSTTLARSSLLCSYGTCACVSCICDKNYKGGALTPSADAYARSMAHKRGGSVSSAITKNGTAVADSITENDGPSISYARGHTGAVSLADAHHGDAKAMSLTNNGFAQSSSQSRFGDIRAQAGRTGTGDNAPDYDDEYYDIATDKSKESMEAETIFKDTNLVFEETSHRTDQAKTKAMGKKQKLVVCAKEKDINASITRTKLENIFKGLNKESRKGSNKKRKRDAPEPEAKGSSKDKTVYHELLLPVGIDVDNAINSSVLIVSNTTGFLLPIRCKNCDDPVSKKDNSKIFQLLKLLKQECNADLTSKAELWKGYKSSSLVNLLETQKLSTKQIEDVVPNVLVNAYKSKSTEKSLEILTNFFKNTTSDEITEIAAIVINAVDYAITTGRLHKMKIMKGLSLNVQSVWTGLLFEFKRCMQGTATCNEPHLQSISKDQNLIVGLYVFLKIADTFYSKAPPGTNPAEIFIRFLKIHKNAILRETECKSKRAAVTVKKSNNKQ